MVVEKDIGGKPIFLRYLPAGSFFGEMAVLSGAPRNATVKAAVASEVIRLKGEQFKAMLGASGRRCARRPRPRSPNAPQMNSFIESRKASYSCAVDLYSDTASFIMKEGLGEATDALLIDENLCVGCDNCEKACADSHEGLSRLDREAGKTFAHLHVPDELPPLRASALHGRLPAERHPPRSRRRSVHGARLHRLRQLHAQLPLWRDPHGSRAAAESRASLRWLLTGFGPGLGEPSPKWTKKQLGDEKPKKIAVKCDMCKAYRAAPRACGRARPARRSASRRRSSCRSRGSKRTPTDGEPVSAPPVEGHAGRARPRAAPRGLPAVMRGSAGRRFRAGSACSIIVELCAGRRDAAAQWRQLVRLYARHDRRGADPLAHRARLSQAQDDQRSLVLEGVDVGARLSGSEPDRRRYLAHGVPARLERAHASHGC